MKKSLIACVLFLSSTLLPGDSFASPSSYTKETRSLLKTLGLNGEGVRLQWDEMLGTPALLEGALNKPSRHTPQWITFGFMRKLKAYYGLSDPIRNLRIEEIRQTDDGGTSLKLQQMLFRTPVYGASLIVRIDKRGVIHRVEGRIYPRLERTLFNRATYPAVSIKKAKAVAIRSYHGEGELIDEPQVQLYYLPSRPGTQLIYEIKFRVKGAAAGEYRALIHAVMGHVVPE